VTARWLLDASRNLGRFTTIVFIIHLLLKRRALIERRSRRSPSEIRHPTGRYANLPCGSGSQLNNGSTRALGKRLLETQETTMFSPANLLHPQHRGDVGQFDLRTALTCARDENIRRSFAFSVAVIRTKSLRLLAPRQHAHNLRRRPRPGPARCRDATLI
jgi:hypothetical protein